MKAPTLTSISANHIKRRSDLREILVNAIDDALDRLDLDKDENLNTTDFHSAVDALRRSDLGESLLMLSRAHRNLSDLHDLWERAQRPDAR